MRRLLTVLLVAALLSVTVLPDDHPLHQSVETAVESLAHAALEAARNALEWIDEAAAEPPHALHAAPDPPDPATEDARVASGEGARIGR